MFVTDKGCNSCYIHVLFDELVEYFCTVGEFRAVFMHVLLPLGLTTLSVYKCILCKIVSFHPDYIYLTVRGEGK